MAATLDEVRRDPRRTPNNLWRRETPGATGWPRSARAGDPSKYFMLCDAEANAPQFSSARVRYRIR